MNRHSLASLLATHGIAPYAAEVAEIVAAARRAGINAVWCAVAADRNQPEVARLRAWLHIAVALDTADRGTTLGERSVG
jgi:hypothetical protein